MNEAKSGTIDIYGNITYDDLSGLYIHDAYVANEESVNGNDTSILSYVAEFGGLFFNIPVSTMKLLARVCKCLRAWVKDRLQRCYNLRERWMPTFVCACLRRCITRMRHITYTDCAQLILPINEELYSSPHGLLPCMHVDADTKYALADISFRVRTPIPFAIMICAEYLGALYPIIYDEIRTDQYIDTGECTNPARGQYYAKMNCGLKMNPLLIGRGGVMARYIHLIVCATPDHDMEEFQGAIMDFEFLFEYFTHMVLRFNTCAVDSHDWDQYHFVPPCTNLNKFHLPTKQLIRKREDINLLI